MVLGSRPRGSGRRITVSEEGMGAPAVVLEARDQLLPIFVVTGQAQAIALGRQDVPLERPLIHDLLVGMVTDFVGAIDEVRIDDLADETSHAKSDAELIRNDDRQRFVFDARPSDGIALAARGECPITVTVEIVDVTRHPPDTSEMETESDIDFIDIGER